MIVIKIKKNYLIEERQRLMTDICSLTGTYFET